MKLVKNNEPPQEPVDPAVIVSLENLLEDYKKGNYSKIFIISKNKYGKVNAFGNDIKISEAKDLWNYFINHVNEFVRKK